MENSKEDERLVLIDTDAGTDDAMAIMMAISAHQDKNMNFRVVGITCVDGNTKLDNVTMNVTRILQMVDATEVPVFRGTGGPLLFPKPEFQSFHGEDGFGDHPDHKSDSMQPKIESEHGVLAIIRFVHQYKNKLTILALGPLTNLGLAIRMDPSIRNLVKDIYIMGGNMEGVGNFTACAEYNFSADPEAANITLASFKCPIIIVPWEVCLKQGTRKHKWRTQVLGKLDTPGAILMNKVEEALLEKHKDKWIPCDQLAAAALIEPKIMEATGDYHCTVELTGRHTRGLMVVDYPNLIGLPNNVTIVTKINEDLLEKMMIWGVGGPKYK